MDKYTDDTSELNGQNFSPEGEDHRGTWGYLRPSGASAVKCGKCGEIVLETYGEEDEHGDQEVTTSHSCWDDSRTPPDSFLEGQKGMNTEAIWQSHITTGEPLTEEEVQAVVAAGLAKEDEFDMRGGNLYWHDPTWPDYEEDWDGTERERREMEAAEAQREGDPSPDEEEC